MGAIGTRLYTNGSLKGSGGEQYDRVQAAYETALALNPELVDSELKYKMTKAYAVLGEKWAALHMLQHTVEGGFFCYPCFLSDPLLQA